MAKITFAVISSPSFMESMGALLKEKIPIRTAFCLKTLINKFNEELKKFNDLRTEILDTHCKKKEDGTPDLTEKGEYQFQNDSIASFNKAFGELMSLEVEFTPVKLEELGNISLTTEQLLAIDSVIEA